MGFFDTVKEKANALASDAGRASKVTAAQARVVVLQNEIRKAERELGHATFDLVERGDLEHAGITEAAARLREAHRALSDKEAEIAALRADAGERQAAAGAAHDVDTAAEAGTVAGPASEPATGRGDAGPGTGASEAAAPEKPAAKKPARKAASRMPAAKTAAGAAPAKPAARKAAGASKANATKPAKKANGSKTTTRKPAAHGGDSAKEPPKPPT
jgi:hypothetical protein